MQEERSLNSYFLQDEIASKISEIANTLTKSDCKSFGLYGELGGKSLFYSAYYQYTKDPFWLDCLMKNIELSFNYFNKTSISFSFGNGAAGLFFLYDYLNRTQGNIINYKEAEDAYKETLIKAMMEQLESGNYDFIHKSIGIAYYIFKDKKNKKLLDSYLDTLINIAQKEKNSFWWKDCFDNDNFGYPNIGVAHGMAGIALFLTFICKEYQSKKAFLLLRKTIEFILTQEQEHFLGSYYPTFSLKEKGKSRLGWCYGDLGIAMALYKAGIVTGNNEYCKKASEIFINSCTRKDLQENLVFDAGLCHGTAGISHIYRRIYFETKDRRFLWANKYWLEETIKMSKYPDGNIGYKSLSQEGFTKTDNSFLEGISGIGLSLLANLTTNPKFLAWDECLMMNL